MKLIKAKAKYGNQHRDSADCGQSDSEGVQIIVNSDDAARRSAWALWEHHLKRRDN
jgi:hypothetical protein